MTPEHVAVLLHEATIALRTQLGEDSPVYKAKAKELRSLSRIYRRLYRDSVTISNWIDDPE